MQKIDILGFEYNDAEPAFTATASGMHYYHIKTKRLYERLAFNRLMGERGKTFAEGELGIPSDAFIAIREDMLENLFTPSPPDAPTVLTATPPAADGTLDLAWTDNSANEAGFRIERSLDDITYVEISSVAAGKVTYVDEGLLDSTLYYYHVYAFNVAGDSTAANASGTTNTP